MRGPYLILLLLLFCIVSCKKESINVGYQSPQKRLYGKWTLDLQHVVTVNAPKTIDTIYRPSTDSYATIRFDTSFSFVSERHYPVGNGVIGSLTIVGKCLFLDPVLELDQMAIAGLRDGDPGFFDILNISPTAGMSKYSITVTKLTSSNMNLHAEYVYWYNNATQTFKVESDYYFVKR